MESRTLQPMLETFVMHFIEKAWRSRVLHEAVLKPAKFEERICHQSVSLFQAGLAGDAVRLPKGDVFHLTTTGFVNLGSVVVMDHNLLADGGLLIAENGRWFFARSEPGHHRPADCFCGVVDL